MESQAGRLNPGDPVVSGALSIPAPDAYEGHQAASRTGVLLVRRLLSGARRESVYRASLVAADLLAAVGAVACALLIAPGDGPAAALFAFVPLIVVIAKLGGGYDRDDLAFGHSTLDEAPALFQLATTFSLVVWLTYGSLVAGRERVDQLLVLWLSLIALILVLRVVARASIRAVGPPERCLLVGDEVNSSWLRAMLTRRLSRQLVVVDRLTPAAFDLQAFRAQGDIDRVIVAPGRNDGDGVGELVRSCRTEGVKVSIVPKVLEAVGCSSVKLDDVEGVTLLSMAPAGFSNASRLVKRTMDVVGASLILLLLAPLGAVIALAIKLDSPGGVFFRQRRVGRGGEYFRMLKFRTMAADAESRKRQLDHLNEAEGLFKIAEDPRITRVGRFLRRTSIDELPQLVNVLRGEMSLVGPRPLIVEEDEQIEGWHRRRLHLTPGMTGHWQILGSARIPLEDMVRIDYLYVTNWSWWLDVKILLRTVPYVLARRGM